MGRKSRHSAKTGDKSLYRSRSSHAADRVGNSDDDEMYNEVERHYNKHIDRDFLRLDDDETEEEEDDGITTKREAVLDLGIASEEDEDDDSESNEDSRVDMDKARSPPSSDEESSDDDDSSHQDNETTDVFNWGSKKHSYYHGDTADLEIGQDENDAILEEEAGKEVQMARLKDMQEEDFILDDHDVAEKKVIPSTKSRRKRKEKALLSSKEKMKIIKSTHPELMPVVDHFRQGLEEFVESTAIVGGALLRDYGVGNEPEAVGSTPEGLQYLITKSMLQASKALNLSLYLLLKAEQASSKSNSASALEHNDNSFVMDDDVDNIQSHPVMDRLNQLSRLTDKLRENVEDKTPGLMHQMRSLVKAAALMNGQYEDSSDESSDKRESDDEAVDVDAGVRDEQDDSRTPLNESCSNSQTEASSDTDEDDEPEAAIQRRIHAEAKFALRNQDIDNSTASKTSTRRTRRITPLSSIDYGDDTEEVSERALEAGRKLASRLNSIAQKSSSVTGKHTQVVGGEDDQDEYERLQRGLSMMDEELGIGSPGGDEEAEGFGDEDEVDFYDRVKSKSKAKKDAKKQLYSVAPKYPRLDEEVEGERAIGRTIMKNRGLVAHKPKINRNPRVKKREQYRKALIRRKGAVREVRTGEGHVYGGESTGIKSGISRSRKLGGGR